ncbi:bifunctional precorrin-2 dehydrogenase/sirohydrochlorin ferrochelatase [Bacteroidota bacterium]
MKKKSTGSYFPVLIDLNSFKALVIGGGKIATRKVNNLLEFKGLITVLAPNFSEGIKSLADNQRITLIQKKYEQGDIDNYKIVFCATGDPIADEEIYEECRQKGILLNVADVPELCNFIMPATIKRGALTVSIGSQGKAPFLVRETRKKLDAFFPDESADIVELAAELREKMMELKIYYDENIRENTIKDFFNLDIGQIIREKGRESAQKAVLDLINKYI